MGTEGVAEDNIKTNKITMNLNIEEIGIKIKITDQKQVKAIISLDFGDFVVKGFRIMESQFENKNGDKLWLTPPSYAGAGGRHHPIFFMPDKELWSKLETKMFSAYEKESREYRKKQYGLKDDDLPL